MSIEILMPALSPTMTEGTLARWLKHQGDRVAAGDVIAEIETDKATMEVEAVDEGVLSRILVPDGTTGVKVNAPIALLDDAEDSAAAAAPTAAPAEAPPSAPLPAPAPNAATPPDLPADRVVASPLARRMAKMAGIDLGAVTGTGPGGRIVRADVQSRLGHAEPAANAPQNAAPAAPQPPRETLPARLPPAATAPATAPTTASTTPAPATPVPGAPHRLIPLTTIRRVTASRLTEAKQTIPHFYVSMDIALDSLLDLRATLNARSPDGDGAFRLSVNDLLIKAAAVALRRVPEVNVSFTQAGIVAYEDVDISIAVAIPGGLVTPILRQADRRGLAALSAETRALIDRARAGRLAPEEYQGGGFTLSNMGMYGVTAFSAIINPPQAAILAIAAAEKRPVARDGALAIATMMSVTLSVDHRAIDGALASRWLGAFRSVVEDPLGLML